jgi:hypothetical protein
MEINKELLLRFRDSLLFTFHPFTFILKIILNDIRSLEKVKKFVLKS